VNNLLHLDSSLRTGGSRSRTLSARYAERWKSKDPCGTVTYRDLAANPVPHLDGIVVSAQYTAPADRTPEQAAAHSLAEALVAEVMAADTILIGMPLYNFGPPSTFKAWFDRIVSEQTLGKLSDKTFVVVTARGGGYGPGTPREGWDHREPWLRHALSTLGVDDPVFVGAELTLAREAPAMIPLGLADAEDESMAAALTAIDALLAI
jgi:FMN-dependent NADH-azoreductase